MGQTVNGKKLPKIIDDADELKEIIKKAIKENENKFFEDKNDNLKIKYIYAKNGKIIEITLHFQRMKNGNYELRTMYPEYGDGVYKYVKNVGWFKSVYDKNTGKWKWIREN